MGPLTHAGLVPALLLDRRSDDRQKLLLNLALSAGIRARWIGDEFAPAIFAEATPQ